MMARAGLLLVALLICNSCLTGGPMIAMPDEFPKDPEVLVPGELRYYPVPDYTLPNYTWSRLVLDVMYEKTRAITRGKHGDVAQYRQAAEQGEPVAQFMLGLMYAMGQGVPRDRHDALGWYLYARSAYEPAALGDVDAQLIMGLLYASNVIGRRANDQLAAEWFARAALQDDVFAQLLLARMYDKGVGVPGSESAARRWYEAAVATAHQTAGDVVAQLVLGIMYTGRYTVPRDYAKVVHWYTRAAEQGSAYAQLVLGNIYARGEWVPRDRSAAIKWWRLAALQGDVVAQYYTGEWYRQAGPQQDYVQAYAWFNIASFNTTAAPGAAVHFPAWSEREWVFGKMTPEQLAAGQRLTQALIREHPLVVTGGWQGF